MNCPKCHGRGWWMSVVLPTAVDPCTLKLVPCDHPDCHAGQVSCAEGENRDEAPAAG